METTNEIIDYVMHTPHNSNPNVMRGILEKSDEGGGDGSSTANKPCITITYSGDGTIADDQTTERSKYSISDSDIDKIIECYNSNKNISAVLKTSENEYYTYGITNYQYETYSITCTFYTDPYFQNFPHYLANVFQIILYKGELSLANIGRPSNT